MVVVVCAPTRWFDVLPDETVNANLVLLATRQLATARDPQTASNPATTKAMIPLRRMVIREGPGTARFHQIQSPVTAPGGGDNRLKVVVLVLAVASAFCGALTVARALYSHRGLLRFHGLEPGAGLGSAAAVAVSGAPRRARPQVTGGDLERRRRLAAVLSQRPLHGHRPPPPARTQPGAHLVRRDHGVRVRSRRAVPRVPVAVADPRAGGAPARRRRRMAVRCRRRRAVRIRRLPRAVSALEQLGRGRPPGRAARRSRRSIHEPAVAPANRRPDVHDGGAVRRHLLDVVRADVAGVAVATPAPPPPTGSQP